MADDEDAILDGYGNYGTPDEIEVFRRMREELGYSEEAVQSLTDAFAYARANPYKGVPTEVADTIKRG